MLLHGSMRFGLGALAAVGGAQAGQGGLFSHPAGPVVQQGLAVQVQGSPL